MNNFSKGLLVGNFGSKLKIGTKIKVFQGENNIKTFTITDDDDVNLDAFVPMAEGGENIGGQFSYTVYDTDYGIGDNYDVLRFNVNNNKQLSLVRLNRGQPGTDDHEEIINIQLVFEGVKTTTNASPETGGGLKRRKYKRKFKKKKTRKKKSKRKKHKTKRRK